jgi:hypothetical protein
VGSTKRSLLLPTLGGIGCVSAVDGQKPKPPAEYPTGDFTTAVRSLWAAAQGHFVAIRRGTPEHPVGDSEIWESTIKLPGAEECSVAYEHKPTDLGQGTETSPANYRCRLRLGTDQRIANSFVTLKLLPAVNSATGLQWKSEPGWRTTRSPLILPLPGTGGEVSAYRFGANSAFWFAQKRDILVLYYFDSRSYVVDVDIEAFDWLKTDAGNSPN